MEFLMPRSPRLVMSGQAHHVIQRGNNRQAIFFEDADRRFFLDRLRIALAEHRCALHAWVLMTNHLHLLLTPETDDRIGRLMQSVGRSYVGYVNRRRGRTGTLWEGRFKSTIVDSEDYVMACYRYIEANPLRAAMVTDAGDHPWSSYRRNAFGRDDGLVRDHPNYRALASTSAERQSLYRQAFAEGLSDELLTTLRDATQRGWVPGRDAFRREVETALGRRLGPPVRGRPPKSGAG
jgi:putative transposase